MKLTIELVPKTAWYSNVRSNVSKTDWDIIRNKCYKNADYKCEVCGGIGDKHPVECHEIWEYNDETKTQTLIGLIALCPKCHKVKHTGLAYKNNQQDIVIKQLMKVNNMTKDKALDYIEESFAIWNKRSMYQWNLDISYLDIYDQQDTLF